MSFCRECGGQVEATWKFCPHCNNEQESSVVIGNDSVHVGDITVNKIDEESLKNSLKQIFDEKMAELAKIGFTKDSSPTELTSSQEAEVEQVLEMSEQLASHGIEIDPWTEITLGNAAELAGRTHSAQQHYLRALETYRKSGDRKGEAASLNNLGNIAQTRGDLAEAERLYRESLAIKREIGNRQGEAHSLELLGDIASDTGNISNDESHRCYTEAVRIRREIGIPIGQWFIDNGY
jgi:tetratricopeptide (TPR) repeat protein